MTPLLTPSLDELVADLTVSLDDPIALCAQANFRWGRCQAILYDPRRPDSSSLFPQPFLYHLYERTRLSGQRHPKPLDLQRRSTLGPLPTLFCGMLNLGPDAVCKYLSERAVCVVGEWRKETGTLKVFNKDTNVEVPSLPDKPPLELPFTYVPGGFPISSELFDIPKQGYEFTYDEPPERFHPIGYCFPSTSVLTTPLSQTGVPSNSVHAGYMIFSDYWRTPQQHVVMYLGLAWLFHTFQLAYLHGSRYPDNHLTARWTRQFGFRDCGTLPASISREPGGPLEPGVFSTLLREEFAGRLRAVLEKLRAIPVVPASSTVPPATEP